MTSSYFKSVSDKENALKILSLNLPSYRQAYSDRTAWVMSVLAELVYIKFNPLFGPVTEGVTNKKKTEYIKQYFIERVTSMIDTDRAATLNSIIEKVAYDHTVEKTKLEEQLVEFDFKVVETFDKGGSQAILIEHNDYLVLAFRGTEPDSLIDIKADAHASIRKCETSGMIHSGFYFAYQEIRKEIEESLLKAAYGKKPLYITGHSLGGALATIATKLIYYKGGLSACYTFGSPRVGNDDWINNIKTPIHRLVNAADCVTMLPPGDATVSILTFLAKLIPGPGYQMATWLKNKFGGYIHAGNMRYLTNCQPGNYDDVKVLYTVSFMYRIKALIYKSLPFKKLLSDHSISVYSKKLMIIAFKRNNPKFDEQVQAPTLKIPAKAAHKSTPIKAKMPEFSSVKQKTNKPTAVEVAESKKPAAAAKAKAIKPTTTNKEVPKP
jgi:triacylglycerol lipase